jgi:NADH-quinone oxidoreductase subunit L
VLWLVGLITAGMTSFYMFRLWFKTFFGEPRSEHHALESHGAPVHARSATTLTLEAEHDEGHAAPSHGVHESPWIMLFPLVILAILSVIGGWVGVPGALGGHDEIGHFLDPVFANGTTEAAAQATGHGLELGLAIVSVLVALAGFYVAYLFYWKKPGTAAEIAGRNHAAYTTLEHKYWVDEFYTNFLVIPLLMFTRGFLELVFDRGVVNGSGRAAGMATRGLAWATRSQISGNIRSYAGWLAIGAAAVLAVMVFGRSLWVHL